MKYRRQHGRIPPLNRELGSSACLETAVNERGPMITLVADATRQRINFGVGETVPLVHATSVADALHRVRAAQASVVLISPSFIQGEKVAAVGNLFSATTRAVALLDDGPVNPAGLLQLGAYGLREAVDLRDCEGWHTLRQLLLDETDPITNRVATVVLPKLEGASPGMRRFFAELVRAGRTMRTVRSFSARLGVTPSTLASRFSRAALLSPRALLSGTRLLFAKALIDEPRRSLSSVANELRYSSPQAFGRHVRHMLGISVGELRRNVTFTDLSEHFVETFIARYTATYRTFDPLAGLYDIGGTRFVAPSFE